MEKRQRIKRFFIRRKDDFLTALEKDWRDYFFRPITWLLWHCGVTANRLTIFSYILLIVPIWMHFAEKSLSWQLLLLTIIGLSDAIDGPLARNYNNITVLGTWLDHLRDGSLIAWVSYLIFYYQLMAVEYLILIWSLQIILAWLSLKPLIVAYFKHSQHRRAVLRSYSLDHLQASVIGRLQFFFWTVSYLALLSHLLWPKEYLLIAGHVLLAIAVVFGAMNIFEAYNKKPLLQPIA